MFRNNLFRMIAVFCALSIFAGFINGDDPVRAPRSNSTNYFPNIIQGPVLDNPVSTLMESFEGVTFPPAGWTKLNPIGGTGWERITGGTTPLPGWNGGVATNPPGGGIGSAYATWTTGGATANDQWLVTPQITNVQPGDSLSFWLRKPGYTNAYLDNIDIKISTTTPTVAGFTINVATIIHPANTSDTNWTRRAYNIGSMVPAGSNIYIAFRERVTDNFNDGAAYQLDLVNVTATSGPVNCTYTYVPQVSGVTTTLYSVKAVSSTVGWVAGAGGVVRRTTDGGTTWTAANTGITGDVYAVEAIDANTAFVTTSPAATFVYKTTNGGTSWTQVFTQTGGFINGIVFQNANTGFIQGDPVGGRWSLFRTTNGGTTWDSSGMYLPQAGTEAGWNNSVFLMGTTIWFGTNNTKVYKSTNFGVGGWTSAPTTGNLNSYNLHFNDPNLGIAGGTTVVTSSTGGTSWNAVTSPPGTGNVTGFEGINTNFWYTRGTGIYRSTNSGSTFTSAFTAAGALQDMDMYDNSGCLVGWAVGNTGTIVKILGTPTGIEQTGSEIPSEYKLSQNYPNPFNPSTSIRFSIPKSGLVSLKVYDIAGKEVATLVNDIKTAGNYLVDFNASDLSSGTYFYRLQAEGFVETKRMMLIK